MTNRKIKKEIERRVAETTFGEAQIMRFCTRTSPTTWRGYSNAAD